VAQVKPAISLRAFLRTRRARAATARSERVDHPALPSPPLEGAPREARSQGTPNHLRLGKERDPYLPRIEAGGMTLEKLADPFEQRTLSARSHMTPSLDAIRLARGRSAVRPRAFHLKDHEIFVGAIGFEQTTPTVST
jgi:hypothetical protein